MIESVEVLYKLYENQSEKITFNAVGTDLEVACDMLGNLEIIRNGDVNYVFCAGVWKTVDIKRGEE
jgi:hypothetical protein